MLIKYVAKIIKIDDMNLLFRKKMLTLQHKSMF